MLVWSDAVKFQSIHETAQTWILARLSVYLSSFNLLSSWLYLSNFIYGFLIFYGAAVKTAFIISKCLWRAFRKQPVKSCLHVNELSFLNNSPFIDQPAGRLWLSTLYAMNNHDCFIWRVGTSTARLFIKMPLNKGETKKFCILN